MFKRLTIAILLTLSIIALAIKPLDRSPLEESLYYQNTIKAFDSIKNNLEETLHPPFFWSE